MTRTTYALDHETPADWWEVEALFDLCFAPGREALSSYRLREGINPVGELCFVARDGDGTLAGAVRNWPVLCGSAPTLLLGPIAVHPTRQGEGLAAMLVGRCIADATKGGWQRILLVGDAPYYGRFGFGKLADIRMPPPTNPDRVLGLALETGAWGGIAGDVVRFDGIETPLASHR